MKAKRVRFNDTGRVRSRSVRSKALIRNEGDRLRSVNAGTERKGGERDARSVRLVRCKPLNSHRKRTERATGGLCVPSKMGSAFSSLSL